ncbi:hypothetical protein Ocin01_00492 [Orchesella cincta]|uniref:O-acyltransferase WSD1 C-terminal domain-containing protein n=1 Tax=Orchesella cincta TaxID=48709 RepID=A0A1D2NLV8_ORCCI|nr:hypothetical protein Ocin01_00492 [Orchesella cincta]
MTFFKLYFRELLRISVAVAILPIFWPVAVVSVILLLSVRYLIQKVLNIFYGKNVYCLVSSGSDGLFGHKTTGNSALIHAFTVLKGQPDLESVRERYKTHVFPYTDPKTGRHNIYDKIKWNLTSKLGFHCWHNKSSSFNLSRHVRYLGGIRPNEVFTEDKLMTLLGKMMSQRQVGDGNQSEYKDMPQWEHLIIPNYRLNHESPDSRPNHFVSIYRVHHAYMDGASFAIFMDSVLSDKPLRYCMDPMKPFPGMTLWRNAWIHFKALTVGPLDFILTLKASILDDSPLILRKYSHKKFVDWSKPIDLDLVKEIKNCSGASIASILVSAITGALRNLQETLAIKQNLKSIVIPETISMGNMVVMLPYPTREMQNHFTTFSVPYPLAEENMIKRLRSSDQIGRSYLGSSEPWFHFYVMKFSALCPKLVQDILMELPAAPLVFSNIPGIKEPFQIFDRQLVDVGAWLPLFKAYGMAISTYSYCNKLRICITSDSKLFETQAQLKSFIRDIETGLHDLAKYHGIEQFKNREEMSASIIANSFSDKLSFRRLSTARSIANG